MARFLNGLNEEILGFVEMFPYHNLQDLVDQSMRTERGKYAPLVGVTLHGCV